MVHEPTGGSGPATRSRYEGRCSGEGCVDPGYRDVEDRMELGPLVASLPLRERRILTMRFYDEMTQARIAAEIGVSQMHVSRLLRKALTQLRVGLLASADDSPEGGPAHARR